MAIKKLTPGDRFEAYHYMTDKMVPVTAKSDSRTDEDGDQVVEIVFANGDEGDAFYSLENNRWEVGEGGTVNQASTPERTWENIEGDAKRIAENLSKKINPVLDKKAKELKRKYSIDLNKAKLLIISELTDKLR